MVQTGRLTRRKHLAPLPVSDPDPLPTAFKRFETGLLRHMAERWRSCQRYRTATLLEDGDQVVDPTPPNLTCPNCRLPDAALDPTCGPARLPRSGGLKSF
ncbi:hypothetical protein IscW_ISCW001754 [Ixodes scapularis]|uniref:Uncharacterized protein n=1 Tax=Ixodes scapularis TaxID=6945 RepID=B7P4D4_IXOSC|nr:hypothetical protein IscW_ISCW001754 [Ixodes scapularis]|eukprot:XP_002405873.1 hypothetical protein IscW_ISCW001754 [Ixodes scapularis]